MKIGDKVIYKTGQGKEARGVIHAIQKADRGKGEVVVGYLVDTGNDVLTDEVITDPRSTEFSKRVDEIVKDKKNPINDHAEAAREVEKQKDLPKSKSVTEIVRQPEQLNVDPKDLRLDK